MSKIKVALRTRPLSLREKEEGHPVVVEVETNSAFITDIRVPEKPAADSRQRFRQFDLDHGFWLTDCGEWGASQEEVYSEMGPNLEKSILEGYNACLLAYGQSGTGKTHTMLGTKTDPGFIPRLCQSLWEKLRESRENSDFKMEVSFMEIYREKVRDLLTPDKPLKLREHPQNGPHVQDLTRVEVSEEIGLVDLLWEGERRRAIGTTGSNRRSSRSHAIWTLYLTYHKGPDYHNLITNQVHLVDLAGSEKAELTTTKNLLAEGADINRSLVSLGNVISSLAEKAQHIPYRDSALTWLLKDSLGGNATTSIIITASPASCCHAQTLNSLRFAQRARLVENQPKVNLSTEDCGHRKGSSTLRGAASIVSIFDIRKDISRLANILKVAQNNGGILRGLTPRNGWTRLITAIESWNVVHGENENPDGESSSIDTMASTPTTTSTASTMTNANNSSSTKSLNDVMVQADLHSFEDLRRGSVVSNPMPSTSSSSSPLAGSQKSHRRKLSQLSDAGQSSLSGSIKCLTWSQSELSTLPKLFDDLTDEEFNNLISPPTPKIHHLKNKFPVHVVPTQNLDPVSRINEKIHGTLNCSLPEPLHIVPKIVKSDCENNFVLIRHRLPTLVNPQRVGVDFVDDTIKRRNSSPTRQSGGGGEKAVRSSGPSPGSTSPNNALNVKNHANSPSADGADGDQQNNKISGKIFQNFEPQPPKTFLVCNKASAKKRTHRPPPKIKEFIFGKPEQLHVFESTDEGEFSDCLEIQLNHSANKSYRTVNKAQVKIHEENIPTDEDSLEEILLFYSGSGASSEAGCEGRGSAVGSPVSLNSKKSKSKSKSNKKSKSKSPCGVTSGNSSSSSPSSSSSTSSSSSSYESLVFQRPSGHVKVVENSIYEFIEDQIEDVQLEDFKTLEMQVTAVSFGQIQEAELSEAIEEETEPILGLLEEDEGQADDPMLQPLDGSTNSKFHNFYVRELSQLEQIGKQIKSLRNLSQRYDVLKPYLKQIEDLQSVDWTKEDPELDAHIEHCSGWNVEIEHRKVQNEVVSISKILKGTTSTPAAGHLGQIMSSGLLNSCSFPNTGAPNGGGGSVGGSGVPRRDSSSTSNRTTSSTSITSDSYSLSASATNTDSRRGSFASSSFVFDPNPSQHSYPHQLSNQNPSYHFSPSNSNTNSNSNSNFPPKYPTSSSFLDLDNSLLFSSLSSAPNSLPSLFSLNLSQNQIPNHQQNSNSNNGKISNSVSHNSNNLNFYQQQQCFSQQQQPPYFQAPLNFDYRRRGGGGSGSGSGSGCNMNIENPINPHQNFELSSPSRQNFNPSNSYNGDIPTNGFYSSSASHSQYGNNGYHNGVSNGFGNGSSSSSNIHNNYPQKGFGGGNPGSGSGPGSVSGMGVGVFKTSDFQMFNNQSQSSVSNSGRGHYPAAEIISSQNSLNQNNCPNSALVNNNSSCPNVHENGYQSHVQQPFYQQSQKILQRSPVAGIPVIPIVPIVPGPTPNSWSPAHNHNFNLTPTHTANYNNSFYGNGNGSKMNGGGNGVESGGGGSIYTNTTPPTKLNGVVKNATAFDFDPLKYTEMNHYNHDEVPSLFQTQTQYQTNGMTPTAKFSFPNPTTNHSYGNGVVNRFSPPDHHHGHHNNGVDSLLLDPSSTSLTGGFSNLSLTTSASSACKSCSMDFCSCQASLSSTLTKTSDRSNLQPQKQNGFSFEFSPQIMSQAQKSRGQRLSGKMQSPTHPHPPLSTGTGGKGKGGGTTNGNSSNNKRHAYPHHRAKSNNNYNNSRTAVTATMISSYD